MATVFNYATVFTPNKIFEQSSVVISDKGKISYVGPMEDAPRTRGPRLDMRGRIIVPGMIDIHVHGGKGVAFGAGNRLGEDLKDYSKWVAESGVTGFLCSISPPNRQSYISTIKTYARLFDEKMPGAEALGLHLEGPFLNVEQRATFDPEWLRPPSIEEAQAYLDAGRGWIRQMTLAPELPGADEVASLFRGAGVVLSLGHSNANYETACTALAGNWNHVTHTYDAQRGLHHRKPGVVGAVLSSDEVAAELIADMIHIHPAAMRILIRCLGTDRVVLITDAMQGAGLPDGTYDLLGHTVTVKNRRVTLASGRLAGSSVLLSQCVRNINKEVGVRLMDAVKMASLNPARAMGFAGRLGSIAVGMDASLAVIDDEVNVYMTMVKGKIVFNNL
jgi:N-acetylglucosamine-6-phosphate deacetylase